MIAEICGVSRGTVDRVLNKRGKVRPDIALRIEETAKALDYLPNTVAKSLATQRRDIRICLILHVQGNPFFDETIKGVERAAGEIKDFGISVSVRRGANFDVDCQLANIDEAVREGYRALILVPINDPRVVARVNELKVQGIPVVFMTSYLDSAEPLCYVGCDYHKSGRIAAELFHLLVGDSARIGMISSPLTMLGPNRRLYGLQSAIGDEYTGMSLVDVREVPSDEGVAYSSTMEMLMKHPEIDGLFYTIGGLIGGLKAVKELGLYGRLKIVSVDLAKHIIDAMEDGGVLATISQEGEEQGYTAIKVAFDYLVAHIVPEVKEYLIEPSIKIKQSL
jgi:LacI family transcriptional regulator